MKKFAILTLIFIGCAQQTSQTDPKLAIGHMLDQWHAAAAKADFETYFGLMAKEAVFLGTDPTENWQLEAFKNFSKPYFDQGKAWSFSAVERQIYMDESAKIAWFDELLDTQMALCRGSGVVVFEDEMWKVKHYVLSIAIPNENVDEVVALKKAFDSTLTQKLRAKFITK